jgi:hypothetical protein
MEHILLKMAPKANRPLPYTGIMERRPNKWASLCKYINRRRNGAVLTRQRILSDLYDEGILGMDCMYMISTKSIDTYRNCLTKAGFLAIISPGRYEKVKTIPYRMSCQDVQRLGGDTYYKGE